MWYAPALSSSSQKHPPRRITPPLMDCKFSPCHTQVSKTSCQINSLEEGGGWVSASNFGFEQTNQPTNNSFIKVLQREVLPGKGDSLTDSPISSLGFCLHWHCPVVLTATKSPCPPCSLAQVWAVPASPLCTAQTGWNSLRITSQEINEMNKENANS